MPEFREPESRTGDPEPGRFIVCGMGQCGYRIVRLLLRLGEPVTVIALEVRDEWRRAVESRGGVVHIGDARDADVLVRFGLVNAKALIAATDNDLVNLEIALDVKQRVPELASVIRIFDRTLARQLEAAFDVRRALSMSAIAAPMFAAAAMGESGVCAFRLNDQFFVVQSEQVTENSPLAQHTLAEIRGDLHIAAIYKQAVTSAAGSDPTKPLEPGDTALTMTPLTDWRVESAGSGSEDSRSSWYSHVGEPFVNCLRPAFWRDGFRQLWLGASLPLRTIFIALNIVILISVGVFHVALHLSVIDALYFVVTTVTTVGYGDITPRHSSVALKLYTCLLMILGSATIATLFSIITDFIVTARFRQLLGRQRVPQQDHFIVVGLGTVGFRLVEKLHGAGARVVAVDRDESGEFVESVRAIVPVVIGDARLKETLNKVALSRARAVLAVTSNDAVNLGVALEAKQINSRVRTVVRLFEPDFAAKVKMQLEVDAAMGAFFVSAPTFAAAALYPDVLHAFVVNDALFSILHCRVRADWRGRTPLEIMRDQGIDIAMSRADTEHDFAVASPDRPLPASDWALAVVRRELVSE